MHHELRLAGKRLVLEIIDQLDQRRLLPGGRPALFKISHDTNADGVFVVSRAFHVPPLNLPQPARTHLHLAVGRAVGAIANHKMIRQTILHAAAAVRGVKNFCVAVGRSAVMRDDVLPLAGVDARAIDGGKRQQFVLRLQV